MHHITGVMMSVCLITGDVNLNQLVNTVSPLSSYYFSFVANNYIGEIF